MSANKKFTSDGKCAVYLGETMIAQSYIGYDGYEVRVLQGMPRIETWNKILSDCPEFAAENDMKPNYVPRLFTNSKPKKIIGSIVII